MPRYIDAYKLYSRLIDAKHLFCKNQLEFRALQPNDKARVDEIDNLISIVINFPTADVVERKKGKWINDGKGLYMCSACGELWTHWWARIVPPNRMCKELRYCPMCGADMREEKTDDRMA